MTLDATEGSEILRLSWIGTLVFSVTAIAAAISPPIFEIPALIVAVTLFGGGLITMMWAFLIAVERSRTDAIGIGGLYFAAGSAPKPVGRILMGSLAIQVIVGLVTASVRVFTSLAFGTLAPLWGLGLAGMWCARHGVFESRHG